MIDRDGLRVANQALGRLNALDHCCETAQERGFPGRRMRLGAGSWFDTGLPQVVPSGADVRACVVAIGICKVASVLPDHIRDLTAQFALDADLAKSLISRRARLMERRP
jgi:hypothetical protein